MPIRHIRRAIVLHLFVILSFTAKAQIAIGIKAGPDFAHLLDALAGYNSSGFTTQLNTNERTYLYGGIFADIPLGKTNMFYLRPQLEYLSTGGQLPEITDYSGNALFLATKYSLHYLDLPVQFLFSPTLPIGKPWIGAGLYYGVLMTASEKEGGFGSTSLTVGNSSNDDIERFDFGYTFTAGLTLKCGVLIGGDFQQGLTRISPPGEPGNPRPDTRNVVWGIHVGYRWTIKNK